MRKRSTCTKIVELSISVLPTKLVIRSDSILCHLYYGLYQPRKDLISSNSFRPECIMTKRNWSMWGKTCQIEVLF